MDLDELAMRLKHGYAQTVRNSDNGENGPSSDPQFWQEYAQWWVKNGMW
jgi:hypothetical protein